MLIDDGLTVFRCSDLYATEPWGGADGGIFTNAVIEINRQGDAEAFLKYLFGVEARTGRQRGERYAPRPCDLDVLLWGAETIETETLVVPHPHLTKRRFVLVPLCDLIPEFIHPQFNLTFRELLDVCDDPLSVRRCGSLKA